MKDLRDLTDFDDTRCKTYKRRKNVWCVRETEILVEQQPPQGVLVCDHAGRVINKLSQVRMALLLLYYSRA